MSGVFCYVLSCSSRALADVNCTQQTLAGCRVLCPVYPLTDCRVGSNAPPPCSILPPSPPPHLFQAAAAARIAKLKADIDIFHAASSGSFVLVRDHLIADPAAIHARDSKCDVLS